MKSVSNTWLYNERKQIDDYVWFGEIFLIERKRCLKILLDLFRYHFNKPENLNILDLGCGDGCVTKMFYDFFPHNNYFLLDGSSAMLDKAKERLPHDNCTFIGQTFEEVTNGTSEETKYDFVFSSNAIHHLDYYGKMRLYNAIFNQLKNGGIFLNIDVIKPNTERTEAYQFRMWTDRIKEYISKNGLIDMEGKFDDTPHIHKSKAENKPSRLFDQLRLLSKAGFRDVDCYYKYSVFAVFGGIK